MMKKKSTRLIGFFFVSAVIAMLAYGLFSVPKGSVALAIDDLQSQINANNEEISALNKKIAQYQAQLQLIGADKKTLQSAIHSLDLQRNKVQAQVSATQHQINATQLQIQQLGGQIGDTQEAISNNRDALGRYLLEIQHQDGSPLVTQLLGSGDLSDFWDGIQQTLQAQNAIRQKVQSLQSQQTDLAHTQANVQEKQDALASQEEDLASQQQSLTSTVKSKAQLLTETKAQEANYQKLLTQAEAELESYSTFAKNAGGSGLVGSQTVCDAWGCYYNQRDSAWGSIPLNKTKYTLASDGCLVTAMAMVLTHYGYRTVTPVTINSNPSNFASYYPAFLLNTINVASTTASRKSATIDATLAAGEPVIVGVKAYGGTHFVVLVSGKSGNYVMRDSYIDNGKDISFLAHYSLKSIYSIAKVVIGS